MNKRAFYFLLSILLIVVTAMSCTLGNKPEEETAPIHKETVWEKIPSEEKAVPMRDEEEIYSFLQGPIAWQTRKKWSGSWGDREMKTGNKFGAFGCGLCCMANIYDTLSPYEASPVDIYRFAKANTKYAPTGRVGAIGWQDMEKALMKLGMVTRLRVSPKDYPTFRQKFKNAQTAIILIQSDDPDSYWGWTGGHYVNIWSYDPEDKTVFVANPGDNTKNRKRVKLKDCYKHLKLVSAYQVLYVDDYDESKDQYKRAKNISESWIRPKYCKKKY